MARLIAHCLAVLVALAVIAPSAAAQSRAVQISRPIEYHNPQWSPDGRTIVFESTLNGKYSVYTISADGTGLRQLTANDSNNEQPTWSPDGRRIAFSSDRAGHLDLYSMNADGSNTVRLTTTTGGGYYGSAFSPDGRWIVFQGRPDNAEVRDRIWIIASDGSGMRQLGDTARGGSGPEWSRDGRTITFTETPYPRRLWSEMTEADMLVARAGERPMSVRADGTGLAPAPVGRKGDSRRRFAAGGAKAFFTSSRDGARAVYESRADGSGVRRIADASVVPGLEPSPDGTRFAYTKTVDGWAGLYVFSIASRTERLITGGPGAGPLGYLRTATVTPGTDTLDTFTSPRTGGEIRKGNGTWVERVVRRIGARRFEATDSWFDSTGALTAKQYGRTARGSLATDLESVRAVGDSATMLITTDRVTAWVVPQGQEAKLFDGASTGERYRRTFVTMAIAQAKPALGSVFEVPSHSLYGSNPLAIQLDSIRVVRHDTLYRGSTPIPVLVLEAGGGSQAWVDVTTGVQLVARGSAGPEQWWWHIRRGITPPRVK